MIDNGQATVGRSRVRLVVAIVVIAVVIVVVFLYLSGQSSSLEAQLTESYSSTDGVFSFKYPGQWSLSVNQAGNTVDVGGISTGERPIELEVMLPFRMGHYSIMGLASSLPQLVRNRLSLTRQLGSVVVSALTDATATVPTNEVVVSEYAINAHPAVIGSIIFGEGDGKTAVVALGLGLQDDYVVTFTLTVPGNQAVAESLDSHRMLLEAAAASLSFTPIVISSGNADLPQVFSQEVGSLQPGVLTFHYPQDWYTLSAGAILLLNTSDPVNTEKPLSGQLQVFIGTPDSNKVFFMSPEDVLNCLVDPTVITATSVMEAVLAMRSPQDPTEYRVSEITRTELNGNEGAMASVVDGVRESLLVTVDTGHRNVIFLSALTPVGEMAQYTETLMDIASTFQYEPVRCPIAP